MKVIMDVFSRLMMDRIIFLGTNNISLDIVNACLEPSLTLYYKGLKFKKKIPGSVEDNVFKTMIFKKFNKIKYISIYENECGLEDVELILKSLD